MLTLDDYKNLQAIVSQARTENVQAAAAVVALYHKLGLIIQEGENGKSADTAANTESSAAKPSRKSNRKRNDPANSSVPPDAA